MGLRRVLVLAASSLALVVVQPRSAEAALTSSEKGQIRDFVAAARAEDAARVRALVARTDLTADESVAALAEAVAPAAFDERRAGFLRELTFGAASASSRPLLAQAVTRSVLARADAIFQRYVGGLDHEPRAIAELVAIYAFVDGAIANAGKPTLAEHDASAGISAAAYEQCAKALREHIEQNARWLKGDGALAESVGRVRAQAQVAFFDMLPDGTTRRVDAAERLGLRGARRQMLTEWGLLLADAGKLDDAKAERVRQLLVRLPAARAELSLLYVGDDRGPLRARGGVAFAGGSARTESTPFGDEVSAATVDPAVLAITGDLAMLAVKRALETRTELRAQAARDAAAAQGDRKRLLGRPGAPSVEHVVGAAAQLLVTDAPRTLDLAFVRALDGRPESAALLSDAIGALALSMAAAGGDAKDGRLELAKGDAPLVMTAIRLAPSGVAQSFALEGHTWTIERAAGAGAVTGVLRDGAPLRRADLATVRPPAKPASPPPAKK